MVVVGVVAVGNTGYHSNNKNKIKSTLFIGPIQESPLKIFESVP